ncbi:hypothetical protein WICPIJ_003283 [Wickerhamomyces pijperi]|uniref:non-specific serine/threonine protein kinase n=1 Tax=Wickerhamomyces pijperi TaxID=599730 RepID=A0A9P8QA82_WICPI|nr:hypothetical protein WICPIJ_003283 [Wickerhamomyces pijperi]
MSSLTKLLRSDPSKKKHEPSHLSSTNEEDYQDDFDLSTAVSIEGVEVPGYENSIDGALLPHEDDGRHDSFSSMNSSSYNQRSPITINPSSYSTAPPIRAPLGTSIHRHPSQSTFNNSYNNNNNGFLSTSIPYSVPNSHHHNAQFNNSQKSELSTSGPRYDGLPSNISMIESTNITSPSVDTSSIEPRFIISKQKVAASQLANSLSKSQLNMQNSFSNTSNGSFFSKSKKGSQMDLGSFYNNTGYHSQATTTTTTTYGFQTTTTTGTSVELTTAPSSVSSSESAVLNRSKHSSMADLKRFFRKPSGSSPKTTNTIAMSPVTAQFTINSSSMTPRDRSGSMSSSYSNNVSGYTTPQQLPFSKRYSKFGEDLGAGAGGSVKLVKRLSDSKTFAVKQFRARNGNETRREYAKKITSEYCIGSTLRHQNIIETIEIAYENDRLLQVLEYCDYDLFAIVMSNKMSEHEVDCCFKQILNGIQYFHHMGLAHRDLKLDNCVVNTNGIVKIIDFGSAVVFNYPFNKTLIEASGIVGSDPYLSPETLVFAKYDPRAVDIWSAAMIYCCMVLKKFPWKIPKLSDQSFKLFCSGRESDSLSALLTKRPAAPTYEEVPQRSKPSAFSNLSKALAKPLNEISNSNSSSSSSSSASPLNSNPETVANTPNETPSQTATPSTEAAPINASVTSEYPEVPEPSAKDSQEEHTSQLTGADRLLKAMPSHTRALIGRMVDLAPACRASIDECLADPWMSSVEFCTVEEHLDGSGFASRVSLHRASNHKHTQVDQSEAHIAALERKKKKNTDRIA